MLTAMYAGYVMAVSIFRPNAAPALPLEARNLRQPDGSSGVKSLAVLLAIAVAITYLFDGWFGARHPDKPADEVMIYGASLATAVCFLFAFVNRKLGVNLLSRMAERVVFVLIPPLALIFLVLGTIFVGIATPTEGGGMGALGALILALMNRRLNWGLLKQAMDSTTRLSCFVIFILIGSSVFSLVFRGVNGDLWVEHLLTSLPGGKAGFLIVVNILFFGLAFFLDFFELAFILVPLVGPVADKMGIDLIWFGVLLGVNMQTSFMHPPFGFALFYLRSVAPKEVKTSDIYWGSVPFVLIQVVMVSLIIAFPQLVSVEKRADMKEQLELRIDTPSENSQPEGQPNLDFSTSEEQKPADGGEPQLNFSTEGDKK
jgi:TRAP-type mannitol/chloroaromatic compound transport system permease large subunit